MYQQKKPIFGQFETFEQMHLHFSLKNTLEIDIHRIFSHIKICRKIFFWKIMFRTLSFIIILCKYVSFGQLSKIPHKIVGLILQDVFFYVSFIPFFVFGFGLLLATKLQKYYVIFVYILQGKMVSCN